MALIVEDGSIVAGAESYASVSYADAYWTVRNDSVWGAYDTAKKEAALRAATQYIDATYKFRGELREASQSLLWPRTGFYGDSGKYYGPEEVPQAVKDATCELAYEWGANGAFMPPADRGNGIKRVKAGSVEVEYTDGASTTKSFLFAARLLADVSMGGANGLNMRLQRV